MVGLDLSVLGEKLKKSREMIGFTLEIASIRTGIPVDALNDFETGNKTPNGDELLILADTYHKPFTIYLSNKSPDTLDLSKELYRLAGEATGEPISNEDREAIQEFEFLCEAESDMEDMLGRTKKYSYHYSASKALHKDQGEQVARQLRGILDLPDDEVSPNIYKLFRQMGVHIFRRPLHAQRLSGFFLMHPSAGRCLLINYVEDIYRQRFSVAHEMAHAIFDSELAVHVSPKTRSGRDLVELRADTFASHFLMPTPILFELSKRCSWSVEDVVEFSQKFRVSGQALAYALYKRGFINKAHHDEVKTARVPREYKQDPELPVDSSPSSALLAKKLLGKGLSTYYVNLAFDAYEQGHISRGKLKSNLLLSEAEVMELGSLVRRKI